MPPNPGDGAMKNLVLETTAPFQGLPELVAYDEGLFEKEGLLVEWADREAGVEKKTEIDITGPKGVNPFASHGRLFEQGKADMYNACEWGNYCRVQETGVKSRQLGRRAIVTYAALVVPPDSPVYTAQQLANRTIGVPFYFGTHYIALHLLEGFLPRDMIKLCQAPNGSRFRLASMLKGDVEATTLTEPHITLAEKKAVGRSAPLSSTAPRSLPTASMPRPMPHSIARCARRCGASTRTSAPISTISSITTQRTIPRSRPSRSTISARAASWCAIPRRSRSTRCSAPSTG